MPQTHHARVTAASDSTTRHYIGHVGQIVHVSEGVPEKDLGALLILEFANGLREVFRPEDLAPAQAGEAQNPDAKPLSVVVVQEPKPRLKKPSAPRSDKAPPGFCLHGHPRADTSDSCQTCNREQHQRAREAKRAAKTKPEGLE